MTQEIYSIEGNRQWLDGGAMFGNCPRALWQRWCPPDDEHRIELACRALLVREDSGRTVLFETGIGVFFEPKLRQRFGVFEDSHRLIQSLAAVLGPSGPIKPEDIDVIVLSHLHFDHVGGLFLPWEEGQPLRFAFPNAHYVVGKECFERNISPGFRDRASFVPELPKMLKESGRLELIEGETSKTLGDGYHFVFSQGHTPGLMISRIESSKGPIYFAADLIPGRPWVHLPITMGYDRFPEKLISEKQQLLDQVIAEDGFLFYTHDAKAALSKVVKDERGRYGAAEEEEMVRWLD